jgi:hypothetical protein
MTITRNNGIAILVAGLAAALLFFRMQRAEWVQYAPEWHRLIREGDATIAALLVALLGLYLTLRR